MQSPGDGMSHGRARMGGHDSNRVGSADWTLRTGGRLSGREMAGLFPPLARGLLANVVGRARLALRMHPGRRSNVDPSALEPPDSALVRDAREAALDLLSPMLLNHSERAYAWGAALGALEQLEFDRELLYVACLLHDTGLPTPLENRDFTIASTAVVDRVVGEHDLAESQVSCIADAICLHHTPGVTLADGAESYLLSAGAAVDVFGIRSWEVPDAVRIEVVDEFPRTGFKREFAALWRAEAKAVPRGRAWFLHRFAASDLMIPLAPFAD